MKAPTIDMSKVTLAIPKSIDSPFKTKDIDKHVQDKILKTKKQKSKSEFVLNVINLLNKNNFNIIEEKSHKEKEYNCILEIKSELGPISFLTQVKHKKTITDSDLKKLLDNSQKMHLPGLILYTGEIGKKAEEFLKEYKSILKARRIE